MIQLAINYNIVDSSTHNFFFYPHYQNIGDTGIGF